jgi:hypothetical protein
VNKIHIKIKYLFYYKRNVTEKRQNSLRKLFVVTTVKRSEAQNFCQIEWLNEFICMVNEYKKGHMGTTERASERRRRGGRKQKAGYINLNNNNLMISSLL